MKRLAVLLALTSVAALGQTLTGTVEKIGRGELRVVVGKQAVAISSDGKTAIHKGATWHDPAVLAVGDKVRIGYHETAGGRPVADDICVWLTLSGTVRESTVNRNAILVTARPGPRPTGRGPETLVLLLPSTALVSRAQLIEGREVQISGWEMGEGVIEAERVAIYNTDVPVDR